MTQDEDLGIFGTIAAAAQHQQLDHLAAPPSGLPADAPVTERVSDAVLASDANDMIHDVVLDNRSDQVEVGRGRAAG